MLGPTRATDRNAGRRPGRGAGLRWRQVAAALTPTLAGELGRLALALAIVLAPAILEPIAVAAWRLAAAIL
jgi:hypothetical protein